MIYEVFNICCEPEVCVIAQGRCDGIRNQHLTLKNLWLNIILTHSKLTFCPFVLHILDIKLFFHFSHPCIEMTGKLPVKSACVFCVRSFKFLGGIPKKVDTFSWNEYFISCLRYMKRF